MQTMSLILVLIFRSNIRVHVTWYVLVNNDG